MNRLTANLKQEAVDTTPLAQRQFANIEAQFVRLGSQSTALRIRFEGIDLCHQLTEPADTRFNGNLIAIPGQDSIYVILRLAR
jgi:hypothetical protein